VIGGWDCFRRKLEGITDGTSDTIPLGTRAMATQVSGDRGIGRFTLSSGAPRDKWDEPITHAGPAVLGLIRAYDPDTVWWLAGVPRSPDANDPDVTDIPGCTDHILSAHGGCLRYTFEVVRNAPALECTNR
jgi:hypothetical protein